MSPKETNEIENHPEVTRRELFERIGTYATGFSLAKEGIEKNITPSDYSRIRLEFNINNAQEHIKEIFNVSKAKIDLWLIDHEITIPEDPSKTLLIGEIKLVRLKNEPPLTEPLKEDNQGPNEVGIENMSQNDLDINNWGISQFPIIISADSAPFLLGEINHIFKNNNSKDLALYLSPFMATFITPVAVKAIIDKIKRKKEKQDDKPHDEIKSSPKKISRRTFSKTIATFLSGLFLGSTGKLLSAEALTKTDNRYLDKENITDSFNRDVVNMLGRYSDILRTARDHIISLNIRSVSNIKFQNEIDTAQLSFGNGHRKIIDYIQEPDTSNSNQFLTNQIEEMFNNTFELIQKYNDLEHQFMIPQILSQYFFMFRPQSIRVNKQENSKSLQYYRENIKRSHDSSAFFILLDKLYNMNETFKNEGNSQAQNLIENTLLFLNELIKNDATDLNSTTFDLGLLGDPNDITGEIRLFNYKYLFSSNHLFVGID